MISTRTTLICVALLLCAVSTTVMGDGAPMVTYSDGTVRGQVVVGQARQFLSLPYGAPPVDELRFEPAQPNAKWSGIRDATEYGPGCPQACDLPPMTCPAAGTSEDCLTLDVTAPLAIDDNARRPVMVFFYGGNYRQGGSATPLYDGYFLANKSEVVTVVPNYRLGALAFFKNSGVKGNLATRDQTAVLRWVQRNIAAFGGDPQSVTIFGQSAGGSSVACHMLSPDAQGLFHAGIMESNPVTLYLKTPKQTAALSAAFAKYLDCDFEDTACLRNRTAAQIVEAQNSVITIDPSAPISVFMPWQPTADGELITGQPMIEFPKGNYNRVPFMLGNVDQEGLLFIYTALPKGLTPAQYRQIVTYVFGLRHAKTVLDMYPVPEGATDARPQLSVLGTDYIWACSHRNISRYMSDFAPLWLWHYDHVMSFNPWGPNFSECADAVCHGAELPFVFNTAIFSSNFSHGVYNFTFTPAEDELTSLLSSQFGNFAHTHNPNQGPTAHSLQWTQYTAQNDVRIRWQTPHSTTETGYRKQQCDTFDTIGYWHGNQLFNSIAQLSREQFKQLGK
jgi:cholinesterase